MFNIGIIGCGKIAQVRHVPEYVSNPDAHLAGFYDLNPARAEELAKQYGTKAYASYEEMLNDAGIDAVSVCAANNAHAEITIAALNAGKHVLCEKPMAVSLEECEAMVAAAQKNNRYLMLGHNQRLAKAHRWAKKLLQEGLIGDVVSFRTVFGHGGPETWSIDPGKTTWFFNKNVAAMGAMADLGVHKTDLIRFLTGKNITAVTAQLTTIDKRYANGELIGVDDNAFCIYQLEGGATGVMLASWTYYGAEDNSTILYGTKGIMRIYDSPNESIKVVLKTGEEICYHIDAIQTNDNQTSSGLIDMFIDSLKNNHEPEISGKDALLTMRAVFAAIKSGETMRTVPVE